MPATILVVEDMPDIQRVLVRLLERAGYQVQVSSTGEDGLACVAQQPPNLVLIDLTLPGMGGLETAQQLRELPGMASCPILAMSGTIDEPMPGDHQPFDYMVAKPFELLGLLDLIRAQLAGASGGARDV